MNSILWIIAAAVFSLIEIFTFNMVTIWFVIGSVCALITSLLDFSTLVQIWVFTITSILCLFFTKPLVAKKIAVQKTSTNADRIIGMTAVVTEDITNEKFAGKVKVNGQEWSAISIDGSVKSEGDTVTIKNIDGVKLIVE